LTFCGQRDRTATSRIVNKTMEIVRIISPSRSNKRSRVFLVCTIFRVQCAPVWGCRRRLGPLFNCLVLAIGAPAGVELFTGGTKLFVSTPAPWLGRFYRGTEGKESSPLRRTREPVPAEMSNRVRRWGQGSLRDPRKSVRPCKIGNGSVCSVERSRPPNGKNFGSSIACGELQTLWVFEGHAA